MKVESIQAKSNDGMNPNGKGRERMLLLLLLSFHFSIHCIGSALTETLHRVHSPSLCFHFSTTRTIEFFNAIERF